MVLAIFWILKRRAAEKKNMKIEETHPWSMLTQFIPLAYIEALLGKLSDIIIALYRDYLLLRDISHLYWCWITLHLTICNLFYRWAICAVLFQVSFTHHHKNYWPYWSWGGVFIMVKLSLVACPFYRPWNCHSVAIRSMQCHLQINVLLDKLCRHRGWKYFPSAVLLL